MKYLWLILVTLLIVPVYGQVDRSLTGKIEKELIILPDIKNIKFLSIPFFKSALDTIQIFGIGEGTHATGEFIALRTQISKDLILQKGYRRIFIESSFGDVAQFERLLMTTNEEIGSLIKKFLFSIYHTQSYREFFEWLRLYNQKHKTHEVVKLIGIDYALITQTALLLTEELENENSLRALCDTIAKQARFQDSIWINMNKKGFRFDMKKVILNGFYMVNNLDVLEKQASKIGFSLSYLAQMCISNIRNAGEPFYAPQVKNKVRPRDELMGSFINKDIIYSHVKSIIWAHNAHISLLPPLAGSGGMGKFIKASNGAYYGLATSTANGTYGATNDRFINNDNVFEVQKLRSPIAESWEALFSKVSAKNFALNLHAFTKTEMNGLRMRFIGYGLQSPGDKNYSSVPLNLMFDGLVFLKTTNSPLIN